MIHCYRDPAVTCDGSCGKLILGGACADLVEAHFHRA